MAFKIDNLSIGRGEFNNCCSGSNEPAWHSYVTDDDISIVSASGYFPDYLGYNDSFVKSNDILWVGAKTNQKGVNFILGTASPVSLINLDPPYYFNTYTTSVTSGGLGTLQVWFNRNQYGIVTFGLYTTSIIQTSTGSPASVNFDLAIPAIYQPNSLYRTNGAMLPTVVQNISNGAAIPIIYRITTVLSVYDSRVSNTLPSNVSMNFQHFSMSYIGA